MESLIDSSVEDIVLNNVYMDINDKEAGASCLLIIKGGKIETLEIFVYIGSLKSDIKQYKIFTAKSNFTDLSQKPPFKYGIKEIYRKM